jgi:hypothetical protein
MPQTYQQFMTSPRYHCLACDDVGLTGDNFTVFVGLLAFVAHLEHYHNINVLVYWKLWVAPAQCAVFVKVE